MANTHHNSQIKRDRRAILSALRMTYPGSLGGEDLYLVLIDGNPEYRRTFLSKDLHYLNEKGYLKFKGAHKIDVPSIRVDNEHLYSLTAKGTEVADQIVDDPALEI